MSKHKEITVDLEIYLRGIDAYDIVWLYGVKELFSAMSMNEIMGALDTDEVLDFIGEDTIRDYLSSRDEKDIA